MNKTSARRLGIELVVITGVLFAAHEYGVVPIEHRVTNSSAELAQLKDEQHRWGGFTVEREQETSDRLAALIHTADELNAMGGQGLEPALMYSRYTSAAARYGVQLERIDPNSRSSSGNTDSATIATGFTLGVSGDYENVIGFIGMLQHDFALTAVDSVRMAPDPENTHDDQGVLATVITRHFGLSEPIVTTAANTGEDDS